MAEIDIKASAVLALTLLNLMFPRAGVAASEAEKRDAERVFSQAGKLREQGQNIGARDEYLKFANLAPLDGRCAWVLIQIGDLEAALGRPTEAMDSYRKVLEIYPKALDVKVARARLESVGREVVRQARERGESSRDDGERMAALAAAGRAYERMGDLLAAIRMYQEARRFASTREQLGVLSEGTLGVLGRAEKEMESGPPVPAEDKWLAMANLCESAQEWDRAAEYYLKLAEIVKEPAARQKYTLRAGGALQSAGKPADAAAACSKVMAAAATSENLAEAYRCAGMASESMKEWGEALTIYETYLEKVSAPGERAWALMRSAWCEERVGNAEGAMNLYREIVETVPRSYMAPEALIGLGILHESGKEYREARAAYGRILEEHAGSHKEAEAKRRIEEVAVKEKEWEKVREKLSGLSEQYPKRERGEGL